MRLEFVVPTLLTTTLIILSGLHIYWAIGGSWGIRVAIPEVNGHPAFKPSRLAILSIAIALFFAACVATFRGFFLFPAFPGSLAHWASIVIGITFFLRSIGDFHYVGFFKRVHGTAFSTWDTYLFSPLCLLIACAFFFVVAS